MGKMSRNKGKRGEREVLELLRAVIDAVYGDCGQEAPQLKRNTLQSDSGGDDIHGVPHLSVEVKFCEVFNLDMWWNQTLAQAQASKAIPVLFYRKSRVKWRVRAWGTALYALDVPLQAVVDMACEDFLAWYKALLRQKLNE